MAVPTTVNEKTTESRPYTEKSSGFLRWTSAWPHMVTSRYLATPLKYENAGSENFGKLINDKITALLE